MKENQPETKASWFHTLKSLVLGVRQKVPVEDVMADLDGLDRVGIDVTLHQVDGDQADVTLEPQQPSRN